ncbi:MAG: GNAT family N-acetyltransferase, partial [Planctomycetia bacterium]
RRLMEKTRIFQALAGLPGRPPVDLPALELLLVRFSRLVLDNPTVREIEVDPLAAGPSGFVALAARIVLHPAATPVADLPRPAIRPYPSHYRRLWTTNQGLEVLFRPIRPEDEPLVVRFHQDLSDESVRLRYFAPMKLNRRTAHERMIRVCFNDYDRELALVAEHRDPTTGAREFLGIGRLVKKRRRPAAEFALLIADRWQRRGLGVKMLSLLLQAAKSEGLERIEADVLAENTGMQRVCEKLGFTLARGLGDPTVKAFRATTDVEPL